MIEVANARINSFAPVAKQANEQPSGEPIFVLTESQLQKIITEATKSLNLKVEALEARIIQLEEDKAKIEALEKDLTTLSDNQLIQLRLIADLRKSQEPQPLQKDRAEILRALLAANNGKMLAIEVRKMMRVPKSSFCELLQTCDFIEKRPYHLDPRQDVLVLK